MKNDVAVWVLGVHPKMQPWGEKGGWDCGAGRFPSNSPLSTPSLLSTKQRHQHSLEWGFQNSVHVITDWGRRRGNLVVEQGGGWHLIGPIGKSRQMNEQGGGLIQFV